MKNTLAQNKQLFNVKAIADSTTLDNLVDGEFGVYAEGSDTSQAATVAFAALPEKFRFVAKLDGQVYYSFDTISKSSIKAANEQAYNAAAVNIWEGVVTSTECDAIATATLRISLDEESLMRERGLSWVNMDSTVVSAPNELTASCEVTGNPVYANHLITRELFKQVNESESPFYIAKCKITGGADLADVAAIDAHIATNKAANTDGVEGTDTATLTLILEAKPAVARNYKDLDVNYIFPRGVRLTPSVKLNGDAGPSIEFSETQEVTYELGAGADLRAEEFECMSLYTNLNNYPQLSDGIASGDLNFQFENGVDYSVVNFEFSTDKVNRNDGDKRNFNVLLATENAGVFTALKTMFIA
tara:strand:- start:692 stop:1768 length:1077 start_codon:yes stop_codon:yes gene_type:complete